MKNDDKHTVEYTSHRLPQYVSEVKGAHQEDASARNTYAP